ncbi:MAG: hypothetical protein FWD76_04750 [Firmicutes bacterium]|nr:hypothetical protein [Bacillota bacterium]
MDIIKICMIGMLTAFCVLLLKDIKGEMALLVGLLGGLVIIFLVIDKLTSVITVFTALTQNTGISSEFLSAIIKIVGLGLVVDFSAGVCEDVGNKGLSEKIVFGGKISILYVALPIITGLFELIGGLLAK